MWESIKAFVAGDAAAGATSLEFTFDVSIGTWPAVLLLATASVVVAAFYSRRLRRLGPRLRTLVVALRVAAVTLALFLVLDPCLVGTRDKTIDRSIAVLFDNSKSMEIVGDDGLSRGERMRERYEDAGSALEKQIEAHFHFVRYVFGRDAHRMSGVADLDFAETETDIVGALEAGQRDLAGAQIAAFVVVSDGVQQPAIADFEDRLEALGAPVFAVGADTTSQWRDLELNELSIQRSNFDKSPVVATLKVFAPGLSGESVVAEILEGSAVMATREFAVDSASERSTVQIEFVPTTRRWSTYTARVRLAETGRADQSVAVEEIRVAGKDSFIQNNARGFVVDNRPKTFRILYLTGSPSWENKFLRRALEEDEELRLTSLVRVARAERTFEFRGRNSSTANPLFQGVYQTNADQPRYDESVFLRLGAEESELVSGYPTQTEDLFEYELVIWGEIEHNFFSSAQLELTRSFVEKRGGALLLTGGPRSFAEGGYRGAIIDGMLPVILRAAREHSHATASAAPFAVAPTVEGRLNGAWNFDADGETNLSFWQSLPELYGLNAFSFVRPGASVMARVDSPDAAFDDQPFYAAQRYGAGQCAVLATGNTWRWHTHTPEDEESTHDRLWRQLVRSLLANVPAFTELRNKADDYIEQGTFPLDIQVRDHAFEAREGLRATVQITTPDGSQETLPVEESIEDIGVYQSEFAPNVPGAYTVAFTAVDETGKESYALEEQLMVQPDRREFQNAQYDPDFLRRIATATGGEFLTLDDLAKLGQRLTAVRNEATKQDVARIHLWHWPPFLALLIVLLVSEWYLRRTRGEA